MKTVTMYIIALCIFIAILIAPYVLGFSGVLSEANSNIVILFSVTVWLLLGPLTACTALIKFANHFDV